MSTGFDGQPLLEPITEDQPCGRSLEDTELLASFDTFAIFGQSTPLDAPAVDGETRVPKPPESPVWREIETKALDALRQSKDLRLLAYLGTALLRTEGIDAFAETLKVAAAWLDTYWKDTHPPIEEDAILRRNALNCFADTMAVVEPLRRVPLVASRKHGRFSLRDVEIVTGQLAAGPQDKPMSEGQITAAFEDLPIDELRLLQDGVDGALASLKAIDARMRQEGGPEAAPTFEPLSTRLEKVARVFHAQLASRGDGTGQPEGDRDTGGVRGGGTVVPGAIGSRQDAIRALDGVAEFFRRNEPSSPIPLLVERAKRLVAKDFLAVLEDIAPDAVAQARTVGGVRAQE